MIPDDVTQSEISALKLLLIELDSKNLQICLIGGWDRKLIKFINDSDEKRKYILDLIGK